MPVCIYICRLQAYKLRIYACFIIRV